MAYEDSTIARRGTIVLQVSSDGLAGGHRQWQHIFAAALGVTQRDCAGAPIDVIEADTGNLAAAKPEIQGAAHYGVGTHHRAAWFAERADQLLDFLSRQSLG